MDTRESRPATRITKVDRTTDCALVVTRTFNGPVQLVFDAWTKPELIMQWWAPKSFGISFLSCVADVRTGGSYRFEFGHPAFDQPMAFFGRYLEVMPLSRLVWTNDESGDAGPVTTVTFEARGDTTFVTVHDQYPSKAALDDAIASGSTGAFPEMFEALDLLLAGAGAV